MWLCRLYARWMRFWFGKPVPYELGRLLILLFPHPRWCMVPHGGHRLALDLTDMLQANILLDGVWEPEFSRWWAYLSSRAAVIFDVGAHCGYFSLLALDHAPGGAHVYAFEPNPRMQNQLRKNIELNGLTNLRVIPKAASEATGALTLHVRRAFEPGASSRHAIPHADSEVCVEAVALDEFCEAHGIAAVDALKMDIEGGEAAAIAGMREGLRVGRYRVLAIETHFSHLGLEAVRGMLGTLAASGYAIFELQGHVAVPVPGVARRLRADNRMLLAVSRAHLPTLEPDARGNLLLPARFRAL